MAQEQLKTLMTKSVGSPEGPKTPGDQIFEELHHQFSKHHWLTVSPFYTITLHQPAMSDLTKWDLGSTGMDEFPIITITPPEITQKMGHTETSIASCDVGNNHFTISLRTESRSFAWFVEPDQDSDNHQVLSIYFQSVRGDEIQTFGDIDYPPRKAVLALLWHEDSFVPVVAHLPGDYKTAFGEPPAPEMPQRLEPSSVNPQPEQPVDETTRLLELAQQKPDAFLNTILDQVKTFYNSVTAIADGRTVIANIGQQDLIIRIGGIYINSKNIVFQIGPLKELPTAALSNLIPATRGYDHSILIEITVGRDDTGQIHTITQGLQYNPIFGYQPLNPDQVPNVNLGSFIPFFQSLRSGLPELSPVHSEGPSQKPRHPSQEDIQRRQLERQEKERSANRKNFSKRNNGRRKARKFHR